MAEDEVLPMLRRAYGDVSWEVLRVDSLDNNDATLAYISYGQYAHYFALFKQNDTFYALDPQLNRTEPLDTYLTLFKDIKGIHFIDSLIRDRGDHLVTREIIHDVFDPDLSI